MLRHCPLRTGADMRRQRDPAGEDSAVRPRFGRIRGDRPPKLVRTQILVARQRAGGGNGRGGSRNATSGKRPSGGRGGVAAWRASHALLAQRARRVVVKARIVRHGPKMPPLRAHLSYLRREGVTRDGQPARMFDAAGDDADVGAFARRAEGDRRHFRFIVSPEDAAELTDLHAYTRNLVQQMEQDLGTGLNWVAVDHWNTDNPHVHLIVRGQTDRGGDLTIHREYITRGLRARAEDLTTMELGPRSEHEIRHRLGREVEADRWTQLDRTLQRMAEQQPEGIVDLRPGTTGPEDDPEIRSLLIGRLQRLEAMGLAQPEGPAQWRLSENAEQTLREMGLRGDIIRTMNRALGREIGEAVIHDLAGPVQPVVGRVASKGLDDELAGRPYLLVEGVDGRSHYVRLGPAADITDIPDQAIVRATADRSGRWTSVRVLSDLPLDRQVTAQGATWLDRELVAREKTPLAPSGFGGEVGAALERRTVHLVGQGLARRRGQQILFVSDLLGTQQREELAEVAKTIGRETGLTHRSMTDGETVRGHYRRRETLASGRFAVIVNEAEGEFSLVPWRPEVERARGHDVAATLRGKSVTWSFGLDRGPEVG
jgi:type IV secretory pathway VirD2 relaxase